MRPDMLSRRDSQERRLNLKSQDQMLKNVVVEGTQVSAWEAQILVDTVHQVYFSELAHQPYRTGQLRYTCASAREGPGKPVDKLALVNVTLNLLTAEDRKIRYRYDSAEARRHRLLRLAAEAREQGGLLTQEDLAELLACDQRTVRRDLAAWRQRGIVVPTRGQQKDIGPGLTHREVAIRQWLDGKEPLDVATAIKHTLTSVERYLHTFCRLVFLCGKGFNKLEMALTLGISSASVGTYHELYENVRRTPGFRLRLREIEVIGTGYYEAIDEKKGALLPKAGPRPLWRKK